MNRFEKLTVVAGIIAFFTWMLLGGYAFAAAAAFMVITTFLMSIESRL